MAQESRRGRVARHGALTRHGRLERVTVLRREFRDTGRIPTREELQTKALDPLTLARDWVAQELSRAQKDRSLVPLDRDPVQDQYSDAVRKYYEKLGSPQ